MVAPYRNALCRSLTIGSMLAAAAAAAPANAERWQELPNYGRYTYRIDLDSVQWQGRIVRYRAEIVNHSRVPPRRGTVTALIDCDTGKHKQLESEHYLPDGSVRRDTVPDRPWKPVQYLSELPRHFLCLNEQSDAPMKTHLRPLSTHSGL